MIDSAKLMSSSLSNLADNLEKGILKVRCKDYDCCLEYESVVMKIFYFVIKIIQSRLMKISKNNSRTHSTFVIIISINVFCY